ncbi:uncharacterized protein [Triticum aestivum]|uniref:non-specific serine/threonine protein kinase n=1 Tax=Aegilops tauschii TaxID=37682 RepID=M8CF69_AEGTA|nr:uncharacterized protein LOC123055055 [Triticum aestivum]
MASRPGTERKATASSAAPAVSAVSRRHHEVAVMGGGASGSSLPGQPYAPQLFPSSQEDEAGSSDLVLSDFQGHTRWTTKNNITSSGVAVVLHDMGNLVLRLPNGTIIWQSFDHPTNTILPDVLTNAPWSAAAIARVQPTPIPTGVVMVLWPTSQDACFGQRSLSIWGIIAAMARTSTSGSPTLPLVSVNKKFLSSARKWQKKEIHKESMLGYLNPSNEIGGEHMEFPIVSFHDIATATDNLSTLTNQKWRVWGEMGNELSGWRRRRGGGATARCSVPVLFEIKTNPCAWAWLRKMGMGLSGKNWTKENIESRYMSPKYVMGGVFSVKLDTYSYGVILLEIASGLKITSPQLVKNYIGLTAYASKLWEDDRLGDRPLMSSVTFTLENESALLPAPRHNLHTLLYGISKLKNEG